MRLRHRDPPVLEGDEAHEGPTIIAARPTRHLVLALRRLSFTQTCCLGLPHMELFSLT